MPNRAPSDSALPSSALQPLAQSQSIRARVTRAIRDAIISGEMVPGEVYSAPALAARFGVSPTPVREAMVDLGKESLVEIVRNKGFRVTEVDDHDLDEIAGLRMLIEPAVVRDAVAGIPSQDFPALRAAAQEIVAEARAGNLIGYTEADKRFHLALLSYGGNARIVKLIDELRDQTRLLGLTDLVDRGVLGQMAEEHLDICDAIEARDSQRVFALMTEHIGKTRGIWAGREQEEPQPAGEA